MSKKGIDVSEYQGIIDWEKVKSQIDFAILRVGWIGNHDNHTIDKKFERNYSECKRLNIPVGCYIYNYCVSAQNIDLSMKWILNNIGDKDFELPIFIDMEDASLENLGKDRLTKIALEFCQELKSYGFKAGVYANRNWFDNFLYKDKLYNKYILWIAHYTDAIEKYKGEYDLWQNSSKGKINGIRGNVDTNLCYYDFSKTVENVDKSKSIEELAIDCINGRYGNGEERKQKLGSLYKEVQSKINSILLNFDTSSIVDNVIKGKYGNGIIRKIKLGILYEDIQKVVNQKLTK